MTPEPRDARVLRCCANIICRRCILDISASTNQGEKRLFSHAPCPFCREPLVEGPPPAAAEGSTSAAAAGAGQPAVAHESPFTYTTADYAVHSEFSASVDYTVTRSKGYTTQAYAATTDYSACGSSSYTSKDYTSQDYTSKDYTSQTYSSKAYSSKDYSSKDYSSSGTYTAKNYTSSF